MFVVSCISRVREDTRRASVHFALVAVAWLKGLVEVAVSRVVVEEGAHVSAYAAVDVCSVLADVEHVLAHQENPGKSV